MRTNTELQFASLATSAHIGQSCTAGIFKVDVFATHDSTKTIVARSVHAATFSHMENSFVSECVLKMNAKDLRLKLNDGREFHVRSLSKNMFIWSSITKKHANANNFEFVKLMNEIEQLRMTRLELLTTRRDDDELRRVANRLFELTEHNGYKTR